MTSEEMKKKKTQLQNDLSKLLTNCDDDVKYFRHLTWALEFISHMLEEYTGLVEIGVSQRDLEEKEEE